MTDEQKAKQLKELQEKYKYDVETCHLEEDRFLCNLLKELGYVKTVEQYEETLKWYT